ncbi:MAG: acetate/propionate family kinase, partial [Fimbriiglobus sp.]
GHADAVRAALDVVAKKFPGEPLAAVGHRVVHGGDRFTAPVRVTPAVLAELDTLTPLAPLHEPANLAGIRAVAEQLPAVPQVACFDTAFHATMPLAERMFGLPRRYFDAGIRRYGFHGLAYESVVGTLRDRGDLPARLIACHLGNGASLCAIRDGKSVATTMGFTPLDGLVMGTRAGSLDPGVVLYLERHDGLTPDAVGALLSRESGLLGVSGVSADMRDLLASPDPRAAEAVELFCYRVVRDIGAMAAALGGADAIAFSGGIGENAGEIRDRITARLGWLGAAVHVVPADEEAVIAARTRDTVGV